MPNSTNKKKIIIIGAGISGLAACKQLIEYGFDATVIEARDRIGGRIWIDNTLGIQLGLGANWMHGTEGNPLLPIAKKTQTEMVLLDATTSIVYDDDGKIISSNDKKNFDTKFVNILEQAKEFALNLDKDISLAEALSHFIKREQLSTVELDLFDTRLNFIEGYIGASCENLSAKHWDDEETFIGGNHFLTSSYKPILNYIGDSCPVQLKTIVTAINVRSNDIEIITDKNNFYADAVVVTVPLGVLKKNRIIFNPPLPEYKLKALNHLGMGLFNLTAIKFPKEFWPNEYHIMRLHQTSKPSIQAYFNLRHYISKPILIGLRGGDTALALENFSDEELMNQIMHDFRKIFGAATPEPEAYVNTRWASDPFSYGSYSYIPPGASTDDHDAIAMTVDNRLYFAGEATSSKYPATTHGAYLSGLREADKIKSHFVN
jgi:monoamine oxidase